MSLLFSKTMFFLKNFVSLCLIWLIQSIFQSIEIVLKVLRKPLSASIDPIYFSINRNCFKSLNEASVCFDQSKLIFDQSKVVNQVFKKSRFDLFRLTFQKFFSNFSLSPNWTKLTYQYFVVFLWIFCKVFLSLSR